MDTSLPTARLGTTGMAITRVGFGAWAIGGADWRFGWGAQDDAESIAAICHAIERGINWIDTAAVYGLGHSETVIAAALRNFAPDDRPLVFTKGGMIWSDDRSAEPRRVATRATLRREVHESLRRLGVERIDLYQVHWPPADQTPLDEYWETMLDLRREGVVRAVGLSNHDAGQVQRAESLGHVDSLQSPFSLIRRQLAETQIRWCADHDTGVLVYSPMQSGLLSGSFTADRVAALPADDWRSRSERFAGDNLRRALTLVDRLRPVAARHSTTVGTIAIAWTLAWRGVTGAIVGARNPGQIDGWIDAARLQLTADDLAEIATAIKASGAGGGPDRPS
ncbi:MAG TPA: aldo/keto reductase [Gemmatimonadales bacterium]|jgi:aryl-alcohol dehydrogenase-like predicted oxidoreductase